MEELNTLEESKAESGGKNLPFKISADPHLPSRVETPLNETLPPDIKSSFVESEYDRLGELPVSYETGLIYLAARDPHWLFVYWDVDLENFDRKLMSEEAVFYLKVYSENGELTDQIAVNSQARNWYFPVKDAGVSYFVELGFYSASLRWSVLGTSNLVLAPRDTFSEGQVEFASVPFHLSFDRMLEMVKKELRAGRTLVGSLADLQGEARKSLQELANDWTDEQRKLLETLIGPELVSQAGISSDVGQVFRQRLSEALAVSSSSPSSSELAFLRGLTQGSAAGHGSSLFSGVGAGWTSGTVGGDTSWSGAGGETSWNAAVGGESSEASDRSWLRSLGNDSTWASGSGVGGNFGGDSSWSGASGSESSWSASSGSESSWSSSPGSSWSGQPFSGGHGGFFLQVNAEVIFHGRTNPNAKLWIDGKLIPVGRDGSFHHHVQTANGEGELPIVAESSDGAEIRSSKLTLKSGTYRTGAS